MQPLSVRVSVLDPELRVAVETVLLAHHVEVADHGPIEIVGPGIVPDPSRVTIAVVDGVVAGVDRVEAGAADAVPIGALDRLPIALALARRQVRTRALETVMALSPDWIELLDADTRLLEVNPTFERLAGISRAEAAGRTPGSLFRAGTHSAAFYEAIERQLASGRTWTGSMVSGRRDGGFSMQEAILSPVMVGGRAVMYVAIKRDASRGWIEADTPRPDRVRTRLEDQASLPWVLHDAEGRIVDLDDGACRLFGGSRADLVGHGLDERDLGRPQVCTPRLWASLAAGEVDVADTTIQTAAGPSPVEVRTCAVRLGDRPFVLTVLVDIAERKRQEDVLRSLARELEEARDAAVRANDAKSSFLANTSHEIRTPLDVILGYTELVLEITTDPETRDDLERIRRAAHHVLSLVDDVLDLARIEAGRVELVKEPVEVAAVVRDVTEAIRPRAEASRARVRVGVVPEGLHLTTDRRRLAQILLNLLGNACKFTGEGDIEVETVVCPDVVRFVVRDNGPGIAPEVLSRLFQAFEQGASRQGGSGLGLAISRGLARALGGEVTADSVVGAGSRFTLVLPRQDCNAEPDHPRE